MSLFECIISFYQTVALSITYDKDWFFIKKPSQFEECLPICFPCWVSANLKPSQRPFPAVVTAAALSNKNHIKRLLTHWVQLMWPITPWNVKMSGSAVVVDSRFQEKKTDIWIHMNDKYTYQSKFDKIPLYYVTSFSFKSKIVHHFKKRNQC